MRNKLVLALSILLLVFCLAVVSHAESGKCGENLTWELDASGTLTISGEGEMDNSTPWYDYKDSIKTVVIDEGVTTIAGDAFGFCGNITNVSLPDSIVSLGNGAFEYCEKLSSITLPSALTSIGTRAFLGCESLTKLDIPASVTSIDPDGTFAECFNLESINVESGSEVYCSVDGVLFDAEKKQLLCYPSNKSDSFYTLPDTVEIIYDSAFFGNKSISDLTIPGSVSQIGSFAFTGCNNLKNVYMEEGLQEIDLFAFQGCDSLTSIKLPASLTTFEGNPFINCSSLTRFEVAEGSQTFSTGEDGILYNADRTTLVAFPGGYPLTSYDISEGVQNIGMYAFEENDNLTAVTFPSSLKSLDVEAFNNCDGLTSIEFKEGLIGINVYAFARCDSLETVTIPASTEEIGMGAFSYDDALTSVKIKGKSTSLYYDGVFDDCGENLTVYAPMGSSAEKHCKANGIQYAVIFTEEEPTESTDTWICPECGAQMNGGKFCSECGAARPGTQVCPSCGYVVPEGMTMKFCPECGAKFE